jgi:predicted Zn-dependent protease
MTPLRLSVLFAFMAAAANLASTTVAAQDFRDADGQRRAQLVSEYCHSSEITSGPDAALRQKILNRFDPLLINVESRTGRVKNVIVALVDSNEINAYNFRLLFNESLICLPVEMVRFTDGDEGELAFVLGHEFGHAYDDQCKSQQGRAAVAGGSQNQLVQQRVCESRADTIGFDLLVGAGYSPFDAAAYFGRFEMFSGDSRTGVLARLKGLLSNHPITPDRIEHLHQLILARLSSQ